jgi:hypothetical protein
MSEPTAPFFTGGALALLALPLLPAPHQLGGVGGTAQTVVIATSLRLLTEDGSTISFKGSFAAFVQPDALDMSVLGRDILNLFAVVIDRPGDEVCLIGRGHRYTISLQP